MMDREKYLADRGWKVIGADNYGQPIWQDPKYSETPKKPERVVAATLPQVGGGTETVRQFLVDPSPWTYPTMEAFAIEKSRENSGLTLEALIAKKREELRSLEALHEEQRQKEAVHDNGAVLGSETGAGVAGARAPVQGPAS